MDQYTRVDLRTKGGWGEEEKERRGKGGKENVELTVLTKRLYLLR